MTEFITRVCHGESRYEVIIKTDNEDHYKTAQDFARSLIGHEKPQTNADRIRSMSDKELAVFLADKVPHGDCYGCRLGCFWTDKGEFESRCQKAWYEWIMLPAEREGENGEE